MKRHLYCIAFALFLSLGMLAQAAEPLRVFIRGGVKTHGPNQHDHPRFLREWKQLLSDRGIRADGSMDFPTAEQLSNTDVIVIYAADGMNITGQNRTNFEEFLRRGGGVVVIHDGVVSGDQHEWAKKVQGGAWIWENRRTKWHEGEVGVYFINPEHPIVRGASNFDWVDEIYYDMDMAPDVQVLATSFHSVFVIAPQLWTYEKTWEGGRAPFRTFVSLPGHEYAVFNTPHYRALLLRGIAWAGKRENVDQYCLPEELASLTYPEGGPTAPEAAAASLITHPEFEVNLVAAEPLIEKAISMDWDPQGRLWVAETPEYPNGRTINRNDAMVALWAVNNPEQVQPAEKEDRPARDRVSWLEDTDGDGRMDKKHVFAEGLELVTSLVFYKDGVIVAQAPDILWLRDTDGDGRCNMQDEKVTLYTGFGTFDTHAVINNFRWGMDGWIYSAIGYSAGNPVSPDGKQFGRVTAGIIRFKPDGTALEQYASGSCNTWGFDFASDGEAFYTTATCGEHFLHIVMPEKAVARGNTGGVRASAVIPDHQSIFPAVHHTRPAYVQIDWVGKFTAAAGCALYTGGAWPDRFNNSHFCSETTMSLVHHELLRPEGVSYVAYKEPGREQTEFIAGTDLWFRPVHTRVGPDGALYVIDFYNQAAIHNDTRGPKHGARNAAVRPDRDHHFGRIWRVQHKQAKTLPDWRFDRNPGNLARMLSHPNGWVRMTAHRLLMEQWQQAPDAVVEVFRNSDSALARMHAMWLLEIARQHGRSDVPDAAFAALEDDSPVVRKNALRAIADSNRREADETSRRRIQNALNAPDHRERLQALLALAALPITDATVQAVVSGWPRFEDRHTQSAALGLANQDPSRFVEAAFKASDPAAISSFVSHMARQIGSRERGAQAADLVILIARQPAEWNAVKREALESLSGALRNNSRVSWSDDLGRALRTLLDSGDVALAGAALPLVARWDSEHSLSAAARPVIDKLENELGDRGVSDDRRAQVAANLLGVRAIDEGIVSTVAGVLRADASPGLKRQVLEALGGTPDPAVGVELVKSIASLPPDMIEAAVGQIVRRGDWSMELVRAIDEGKVNLASLGPAVIHRLRTHSDRAVAERAIAVVEKIRGPQQREKNALIAQLAPEITKPGNLESGKQVFTENCANCHKFKGEGRDVAPDLTGMGAHGGLDLLVHIVDPNRLVEPNFVTVSVETKDGEVIDGIVASENANVVALRTATADFEVQQSNIARRRSTGLSLMPEGFEALGPEKLRDLIAFLCADENRYRILDLGPAFTANSTRGIYGSEERGNESLRFTRFGLTKVDGIPFEVVHPTRTENGYNVIVLKGGDGFAKTRPQKVTIRAGVPATELHFLGGVGGWAWPWGGDEMKDRPVAKVTLALAGGGTEEIVLRNGQEFADYNGRAEVPGSKEVPGLVRYGQVRWFSKPVRSRHVIESITIESYDNAVAPTFVAITAELPDPAAAQGIQDSTRIESRVENRTDDPILKRTLIVGGGTHHDFARWFKADSETLAGTGLTEVEYTEDIASVKDRLDKIDVLYWSSNQPMPDRELRTKILEFARQKGRLLLVHPGLWYNWSDWPEYNRELASGGARSHGPFGEFEVTVVDREHPLTQGLPPSFKIRDELYRFQKDPNGPPIHVLATGLEKSSGKSFPVAWVTQHPDARIVCITLGHDGWSHNHPAYQRLLRNSLRWLLSNDMNGTSRR